MKRHLTARRFSFVDFKTIRATMHLTIHADASYSRPSDAELDARLGLARHDAELLYADWAPTLACRLHFLGQIFIRAGWASWRNVNMHANISYSYIMFTTNFAIMPHFRPKMHAPPADECHSLS